MRFISSIISIAIYGLLATSVVGQTDSTQEDRLASQLLGRNAGNGLTENITITDAVRSALSIARVPGGMASIIGCGEEIKYDLKPAGRSLRDLLDAAILTDYRYRWLVEDGVVNLIPSFGDPDMLNLRIDEFHVKDADNLSLPLQQLLDLPEVRKRTADLGLIQRQPQIGLSSLPRPGVIEPVKKGFNVDFKNGTLRQALNAIARAHGYGVWAYTEQHCGERNELSINFVVR